MLGPFAALVCIIVLGVATPARADQRRDFMLDRAPGGNFLVFDYFGTGAQLTAEHRAPIYGAANDVTAGVNTLLGYPLGQVTAFTNLRVLFLEFGGMLGYRTVWRNLHFDKGKDTYCVSCDRSSRRKLDPLFGAGPATDNFGFAEGKLQLYAPLNEHVLFTTVFAGRAEQSEARSFDWFNANIHDGGFIGRWESMLFFKHRAWGGLSPYVQVMFLPRGGQHDTELAVGFNAIARLGLVERNDLLVLTFLTRPGDRYYGQHGYYSPVRALLVYRLILAL